MTFRQNLTQFITDTRACTNIIARLRFANRTILANRTRGFGRSGICRSGSKKQRATGNVYTAAMAEVAKSQGVNLC